ncbi:MAG TPA: Gfo/Idh/MocA family oxidoreductase [Solirubrobacteraceae bacterium]
MATRKRVGVIGCGLIAQVMHLPYLAELSDRFEIAALCDVSDEVVEACAQRYGVSLIFTRAEDLLEQPLDAVMVLIPGDHAPLAIAAADRGLHVFVEKPMAVSAAQCGEMIRAADAAGISLMVGTMKRYDRAYERFAELVPVLEDPRLVRVETLESPLEPYVSHYPLVRATRPPARELIARWEGEERPHLDLALDSDPDETNRFVYRNILLDNLVHEFNMLRGAFGEPTVVCYASLDPQSVAVHLRFGDLDCHLSWVDLPGIARYKQEVALYGPDQRLVLTLPSPFLRSAPTRLSVEGGERGTSHAWNRDEVVSYDSAFKRELEEFHDSIVSGRPPRTTGADGLRDLLLCEAIARAHRTGAPVPYPTEPPAADSTTFIASSR